MELTIEPVRGHLQIDDARLVFKNFEGRREQYNDEGDRNFAIVIPTDEMKDALVAAGWNVTIKAPRTPEEDPFMYLKVKVRFNMYGPTAYLNSNGNPRTLDEGTIGMLDHIKLARVDLDIRPYDWNHGGRSGRTAYLERIHAVQGFDHVDRFAAMYPELNGNGSLPF
jgi:hypothetical protein